MENIVSEYVDEKEKRGELVRKNNKGELKMEYYVLSDKEGNIYSIKNDRLPLGDSLGKMTINSLLVNPEVFIE